MDQELNSYVDDMDYQFETLRDRFNDAAAYGGTKSADLVPLAKACAIIGKTLFEIKSSPVYAALLERNEAAEAASAAALTKPSGMG